MKLFHKLLQYSFTSINRFLSFVGGHFGYNGIKFQKSGRCTVTQEKLHISITLEHEKNKMHSNANAACQNGQSSMFSHQHFHFAKGQL